MAHQVLCNDTQKLNESLIRTRIGNSTYQDTSSKCIITLEADEVIKVVLLLYYIVVMVLAILGNTLIIYIVFYNKSIRTSTNIFIVNMAVCDLGIPFFLLPKLIAELFIGRYVWLIPGEVGEVLCKIVPFVHDVLINCSTFSLLLITFDRFCAVLLPHKRHLLSNKVVIILISCAWLVSISITAVLIKIFHFIQASGTMICRPIWNNPRSFKTYFITLTCTNIIVPIVLTTTAYSAIFHKLKEQVLILGDAISDQVRQQQYLRQKKIVKMAFAIVCAFAVCWLPFAIAMFISLHFINLATPCWFNTFGAVSNKILTLISVTNPTICFIFGTIFREELRKICRRVFSCCFFRSGKVEESNSNDKRHSDAAEQQ